MPKTRTTFSYFPTWLWFTFLKLFWKEGKLLYRHSGFNFCLLCSVSIVESAGLPRKFCYILPSVSFSPLPPRNSRNATVNFFAYINFNSPYMSANLLSRKERLIPSDWKLKYSASHSWCVTGSLCGHGSSWLVQFQPPNPLTLMATSYVQGHDDCLQELLLSTKEGKINVQTILEHLQGQY